MDPKLKIKLEAIRKKEDERSKVCSFENIQKNVVKIKEKFNNVSQSQFGATFSKEETLRRKPPDVMQRSFRSKSCYFEKYGDIYNLAEKNNLKVEKNQKPVSDNKLRAESEVQEVQEKTLESMNTNNSPLIKENFEDVLEIKDSSNILKEEDFQLNRSDLRRRSIKFKSCDLENIGDIINSEDINSLKTRGVQTLVSNNDLIKKSEEDEMHIQRFETIKKDQFQVIKEEFSDVSESPIVSTFSNKEALRIDSNDVVRRSIRTMTFDLKNNGNCIISEENNKSKINQKQILASENRITSESVMNEVQDKTLESINTNISSLNIDEFCTAFEKGNKPVLKEKDFEKKHFDPLRDDRVFYEESKSSLKIHKEIINPVLKRRSISISSKKSLFSKDTVNLTNAVPDNSFELVINDKTRFVMSNSIYSNEYLPYSKLESNSKEKKKNEFSSCQEVSTVFFKKTTDEIQKGRTEYNQKNNTDLNNAKKETKIAKNDISFPLLPLATSEKISENKLKWENIFSVNISGGTLNNEDKSSMQINFLKQLFLLNWHCRNVLKLKHSEKNLPAPTQDCKNKDFFYFQDTNNDFSPKNYSNEVSSADIVLKTLSLCDEFLLQSVFTKMTSCQLAVPIISLWDEKPQFNLWAMRTVQKSWKKFASNNSLQVHHAFISRIKMGTISFCRIGDTKFSKSKLANHFLSYSQKRQDHSYFLRKGNDPVSKLNKGCIEACWYCPDGNKSEHLRDIHGIYNLRGDARNHKEQFKFLFRVSSVVIVLRENINLKKDEIDLIESFDGCVILVNLAQSGDEGYSGNNFLINALNMNAKLLLEKLISKIKPFSQKLLSIEDQAEFAIEFNFNVDENTPACIEGKKAALELVTNLNEHEINNLKSIVFPLQGNDWFQWAELDKEESRHQLRCDISPQEYSSDISKRKKQHRRNQLERGISCEVDFFLKKLLALKEINERKYFMQWCQIELNSMSENYLSIILKDYTESNKKRDDLRKQLQLALSNQDNNEINIITKRLTEEEKINQTFPEKISIATFGVENFLRELSQFYESYNNESYKNKNTIVSKIPEIMVDLFLMGYPLEILDGDTSHVPIYWIKKVFSVLKKKLGKDINVFVLSMLGTQSSGKSTLLNTMFGTDFRVSSGRCTKGVFLKLLPVSHQLRQKLNCDYFIIVDSEGLRSPERKDSIRNDNEVATFVMCIANLNLINFWGQTFSKDISDILQIAAHAYIRMKEVKIKSSFHLIFAGVSDITAEQNNRLGVDTILKELDTKILNIANDEGKSNLFNGLSSVFPLIQEQLDNYIFPKYLPALWQSSMSPPESKYGEVAQQLKDSICNGLEQYKNRTLRIQPLSEFANRILDVWEAIKQEHFVFGFKNSHAINMFWKLQEWYDKEIALLRKNIDVLTNQIAEKSLQEVTELEDENKGFKNYIEKMEQHINTNIENLQNHFVENLKTYIRQMPEPELGLSYLSSFTEDMKKKVKAWIKLEKEQTKERISSISIKERPAQKKLTDLRKKYSLDLDKLVIEVKVKYGDCIEESLIHNEFQEFFSKLVDREKNMKEELVISLPDLLDKIFSDCHNLLLDKLNKLNHSKNDNDLYKKSVEYFSFVKGFIEHDNDSLFNIPLKSKEITCISKYTIQHILKKVFKEKNLKKANEKKNLIIKHVKEIITESNKETVSNCRYYHLVADIMDISYDGLKEPAVHSFEFSKDFKTNFLIKIFGASLNKITFLKWNQINTQSNAIHLAQLKQELFRVFQIECLTADKNQREGLTIVNVIFDKLIENQVKYYVGSKIFDLLLKKPEFINKSNMMYHILKELINGPYIQIESYINDYKNYVKNWIKKKVTGYCLEKSYLETCIVEKIQSVIFLVSNILKNNESESYKSSLQWCKTLDEKLKEINITNQFSLINVAGMLHNITDFQKFSKIIQTSLTEPSYKDRIFNQIFQTATEFDVSEKNNNLAVHRLLEWFVGSPFQNMQDQMLGCTAQCPLCGAVCASGIKCITKPPSSQRHHVEIHMPMGMIGYCNNDDYLNSDICTSIISLVNNSKGTQANKTQYRITNNDNIPFSGAVKHLNDWNILYKPKASATEFWQYLFVKHQREFAKHHNVEENKDVLKIWSSVTSKDALKNLKEVYKNNEESSDSEEEADSEVDLECSICSNNPRDKCCFLPCGHASFCRECAQKVYEERSICPNCRFPIEKIQNVFY